MKRYPSCIMATTVVPWDEHGNFVEDLFRHQVKTMLQCTRHLYVFGTAGEGYAVTNAQFERIVRVFQETMRAESAEPMVGVINLSLPIILERITWCRDQGIKQFQISLPSWGALTEKETFEFFRQVCGRFRDCQFLHYNLMRTKRLVTPDEYARLAQEHPNLVATKNSTDAMDRIEGLMSLAPQLQHFLTETGFAYGAMIGECGLLASVALTNTRSAQAYFEAARKRDGTALFAMQTELNALTRDLVSVAGDQPRIDGAFDKLLWRLHDRRFPLRLLPPYDGLSEAVFDRFAATLKQKYPRWAPE